LPSVIKNAVIDGEKKPLMRKARIARPMFKLPVRTQSVARARAMTMRLRMRRWSSERRGGFIALLISLRAFGPQFDFE
jgi:hypothetical protein